MGRGKYPSSYMVLNGANKSGLIPTEVQDGFDQKSRGGLAIGSGDTNDLELLHWMSVKIGAQSSQGPSPMLHHNPCGFGADMLFRRVRENCHSAIGKGCINVAVSVSALAAYGYKKPAGVHAARVIVKAQNVRIAASGYQPRTAQQL